MQLNDLLSYGRWFLLIVLAFKTLELLSGVPRLFKLAAGNRHAARRRPDDISHLQIPPPDKVQAIIQTLKGLGFERLGEFRVSATPHSEPLKGWVLVDAERTTHVETAMAGMVAIAVFVSTFYDNAILETGHPGGSRPLDDPDYRVRIVPESVETAYRTHRAGLADFQVRHSRPREMQDMGDFIAYSVLYNTRYARRKIVPALRRTVVRVVSQVYGIAVVLVALFGKQFIPLTPEQVLVAAVVLLLPSFIADLWAMDRLWPLRIGARRG
jgi:hypothetical protein